MARPRKTQSEPDAKERMSEAFWQLLEKYEIRDITVGMITAQANCNRGTFYYHHDDFDSFVANTIESELFGANILAEGIFHMATDETFNIFEELNPRLARRINLVIERVGLEIIFSRIHEAATAFWAMVASAEEQQRLLPEAEVVIDYYVGGVLSVLAARPDALRPSMLEGEEPVSPVVVSFVRRNCRFLLDELCEIQGVSIDFVLTRLSAVNAYLKAQRH